MQRPYLIIGALLVTGLTAFGCATTGGGNWTTLIDGEKGLENFNRIGDANWRAEGGAIVADKGKGGHQFGNRGKEPGDVIKFRKLEIRPL